MAISLRTDFPGGNGLLLGADESGGRSALRFAAEPRNCPQALWFHFRLSGLGGRGVRVVLANPEQTLGGSDWSRNRPVCRCGDGPWARLGLPGRVDTAGGRVEWAWDIDADADEIEMAHCFPYQLAELEATLARLEGAFQAEMIGVTLAGRPMPRVFNRLPGGNQPGVFLTARHHAGETPGSWALDGLMRHVAAHTRLFEKIAWWAVPMVNLDDVIAGSYGKDPFPHDCNRAYGPGTPRRPEAFAVMRDAGRLKDTCTRMLFIDIHAPGHPERANYVPLRGWDNDSPITPIGEEFANRFLAAQPADIRSPKAHVTPKPGGNDVYAGTSSRTWAQTVLGVEAISLEISYQGNEEKDYAVEDYHRLGAALAETAAQWVLETKES